MFKTIVVGVDGHEGGADALALAARLATLSGANLVAVRALRYGGPTAWTGSRAFAVAVERAGAALDGALAEAGVEGRGRVLVDRAPARALHRVAEEEDAGLIVVGSTRRGAAERVLAGDDAAATVHASPCAVAVAPRGFAGRSWTPVTQIGVGFDGRPEARQALALAAGLAEGSAADIRVMTAVPAPVAGGEASAYDRDWLERAKAAALDDLHVALDGVHGKVTATVAAGGPVSELVELSAEVDLLVVGSRAWGPVRRTLAGSTATRLMRQAHCPVLVLPRGIATGEPGERPGTRATAPAAA